MTTGINEAFILSLVMAAVIFFCRIFPFLFFNNKTDGETKSKKFISFIEKIVPPAAMTVLAFNALAKPVKTNPDILLPSLAAAAFTAIVHIWKKNPLISIFGGTALFMILTRILLN